MTTFRALALCQLLWLAGCAGRELLPGWEAEAGEPLICETTAQCALYWKRANFWVATYGDYKVQISNEYLIQTESAPMHSAHWAMKVTREPLEGERERIVFLPSCGEVSMCRAKPQELMVQFKRYVTGVT